MRHTCAQVFLDNSTVQSIEDRFQAVTATSIAINRQNKVSISDIEDISLDNALALAPQKSLKDTPNETVLLSIF